MSRIFYDHLVILTEIETEIKTISESPEEREELWKLVDEIVNHRILITILDHLPLEHHDEFLTKFHEAPHHNSHIDYLNEKIEFNEDIKNAESLIKKEILFLEKELLGEIHSLKTK